MTSNVVPYQAPAAPAVSSWRGVQPGDFDSAIRMAQAIARSGMAPKSYYQGDADPVAAVFTAMQLGAEIGLSPMTAVRSIAVINGLPGLYGPAMLGVVEASGKLVEIDEGVTGEGAGRHAWCTVQRVGRKPRTFTFSMADAGKANLTEKRGPWTEYPDRMLLARARTFALRDVFPDVLLGLSYSVEELADIPAEPSRDAPPRVVPAVPESPKPVATPKPPLLVNLPDGWEPAQFPRTGKGLREALEFLTGAVVDGAPQVVAMNIDLLDTIAEKVPALAEEVANLRAAAAEAMAAADADELADDTTDDPDDFPGDRPSGS
jgi:hypothetical protein